MPAKLDRCVGNVKMQGESTGSAFAICRAQLGSDADIKRRKKKDAKPSK